MDQRTLKRLRVLDFDIENRPLSYLGMDFTTGEITAIAWQFVGEPKTAGCVLLEPGMSVRDLLAPFISVYNAADMVTGHYIKKHDLPVISGALLECGMAPLSPKLAQDTKLDLIRAKHMSCSQESLAGMLGVKAPKVHMTQPGWREANRLTPAGIAKTRKRVIGDVRQHIQMRERLLALGALKAPREWKP